VTGADWRPTVGDPPATAPRDGEVVWLLGTQLSTRSGPLARADAGSGTRVLMIESHGFARRKPYHAQKLTLVFAAMRRFRDRLRAAGYDVTYLSRETFGDALEAFFDANPDATLLLQRSPSHGSTRRFAELVDAAGGDLRPVENELFVSTRRAFDEWANDDGDRDSDGDGGSGGGGGWGDPVTADADGTAGPFRHEEFYRFMRRESGVLMDGDRPAGGEWNYDDRNREFPPDDWEAPPVPEYDHGAVVEETAAWVAGEFETWGTVDGFRWPVTREGARDHLRHFVGVRLPEFGPYQDAMRSDDWAMAHALLGSSINLGLLHPLEVVEAAEAAYRDGEAPLASVEGFVRQVLGWREFMRHVYRHAMPGLATANRLEARRDLPDLYWTGDTRMNCLAETVADVRARGYSHHIQRLMVLANFATLWGVEPAELNDWFHATYVDAYHWVTTPNVVEMGQYAHGAFATKPYVSSANYVDRMSDYCGDCEYDESRAVGEAACPFNALYWAFLDRNEDDLRSNHRMALMYGHVDDKRDSGAMADVRERVEQLRELAAEGKL